LLPVPFSRNISMRKKTSFSNGPALAAIPSKTMGIRRGSNGHNENASGNTQQQRMKEERIKRGHGMDRTEPKKPEEPEKPNKRER
jgi:hypothetical protein